ncbi:hypothetical protein GH741_14535 [Aquibacillus halophilus]|uniref:Uncharacterized protein n=1 Tax=Aquibacillus halophilus TaxID=930132 RepID=A0A6A8DLI6_9BACI|nr:hypothetical protein [Aquibacillus halophilus]MRH43857.1 hypothetical protein [Aquibacillus halophilus]
MFLLISLGLLIIIAIIFLFTRRTKDTVLQSMTVGKFLDYKSNIEPNESKNGGVIDTINDFFDDGSGNNGGSDGGEGGDDL